jgi:uncharacterized GH25 family protein
MKILKTFLPVLLLTQMCFAHEFWLQPRIFNPEQAGETPIDIRVGMNFEGDTWGGNLSRVHDIVYFHGDKQAKLVDEGGLIEPVIQFKTDQTGQYLLGFTNQSTFIELKGAEFEDYVLSEGLDSVVEQREKLGESEKPGRELYRRCAKTLIQVGDGAGSEAYGQKFQFPLELTALNNPYEADTALQSFRLTFEGRPLVNAQVLVWHKNGESVNRRVRRTDQDGQIQFPLTPSGKWMVSTVHMKRIEDNPEADWQSYWGSYTFGF